MLDLTHHLNSLFPHLSVEIFVKASDKHTERQCEHPRAVDLVLSMPSRPKDGPCGPVPRDSDLKFETFMELNNDLSNLVIWHFILAKNLCKVAAPPSSFPIIFNDGADDVTFVSKYSKGKTFRSVVERQSETILIGACRKLLLGVVLLQCDCRLSAPVA
ncbi:uncharacterized protein PADG_11699 [Paracoccidioides brasiliensis Pb18]|uniref:Uncharacterized protein n=1 Tax=Paracoccidioides brasiliensis (strain Pb18) TaxID=502780 RepID=A0A0A0HVU3_PARBD|nr:uncharacterized protein PADG_11699 [Paracoccidioides brasiliensis Pb18]KGM92161.1 hypothetical protein PADG_11699 [Paracoccidioides brasiliensis Pb18]